MRRYSKFALDGSPWASLIKRTCVGRVSVAALAVLWIALPWHTASGVESNEFFDAVKIMTAGGYSEAAALFKECMEEQPGSVGARVNFADCVLLGGLHSARVQAENAADRAIELCDVYLSTGDGTKTAHYLNCKQKSYRILGQLQLESALAMRRNDGTLLERIAGLTKAVSQLEQGMAGEPLERAKFELYEHQEKLQDRKLQLRSEVTSIVNLQDAHLTDLKNADALLDILVQLSTPEEQAKVLEERLAIVRLRDVRTAVIRESLEQWEKKRDWKKCLTGTRELRVDAPQDTSLLRREQQARQRDSTVVALRQSAETARQELNHPLLLERLRELKPRDKRDREVDHRDAQESTYSILVGAAVDAREWEAAADLREEAWSRDGIEIVPSPDEVLAEILDKHGQVLVIVGVLLIACIAVVSTQMRSAKRTAEARRILARSRRELKKAKYKEALGSAGEAWCLSGTVRTPDTESLIAELSQRISWGALPKKDAIELLDSVALARAQVRDAGTLVKIAWFEAIGHLQRDGGGWEQALDHADAVLESRGSPEGLRWIPSSLLSGLFLPKREARARTDKDWEDVVWSTGENLPTDCAMAKLSDDDKSRCGKVLGARLAALLEESPDRRDRVLQLVPSGSGGDAIGSDGTWAWRSQGMVDWRRHARAVTGSQEREARRRGATTSSARCSESGAAGL